MSLLEFLWFTWVIGGRKIPLSPYFEDKFSLEELRNYDPGVVIRTIKDKEGAFRIVVWSKPPSELFQALPKCPRMHHTLVETLWTIMKTLIHKASPFKRDTDPFKQDRFKEVLKALQENMEEQA